MTIYSQINNNKFKTYLIIFLFVILVTGFFFILGSYFSSPATYFVIGFAFSFLSGLGSYYYSDKIVLFTTGAKLANKKQYFDFYTVTENLSLAAGLPMPKLYVIDDPAPNAFATGRNPAHAVVCATTGLLQKLERAEIEGVVAHELSHIQNYDILLASIVSVLVGTIALISNWIMRAFWWGGLSDRNDRGRGKSVLGLVLIVVAIILAPIIATLIQLAISRRREFLADAKGVLITRYPEGLARALEKISSDSFGLKKASPSTAHLFISDPFKKGKGLSNWFVSLFRTHPPIEERVKILRRM